MLGVATRTCAHLVPANAWRLPQFDAFPVTAQNHQAFAQLTARLTSVGATGFVQVVSWACEYLEAAHPPFPPAFGFDSLAVGRLAGRLFAREVRAARLADDPSREDMSAVETTALETLPRAVDVEVMFRHAPDRGPEFERSVARLHPYSDARVRLTLRSLERGLALRGHEIGDVAADVWQRLLESPPRGPGNRYEGAPGEVERWRDPIGVFYLWLHRVARNRGLDILARKAPRTVGLDGAGGDADAVDVSAPDVAQDAALQHKQTLAALRRLATALSPSLRTMALSLIEHPDLTHEERARELGFVPPGESFEAHRQRYDTQRCRARAALARAAEEQGFR
jgi:DNA-directed RNA polymerase specialized sigma24 family protein